MTLSRISSCVQEDSLSKCGSRLSFDLPQTLRSRAQSGTWDAGDIKRAGWDAGGCHSTCPVDQEWAPKQAVSSSLFCSGVILCLLECAAPAGWTRFMVAFFVGSEQLLTLQKRLKAVIWAFQVFWTVLKTDFFVPFGDQLKEKNCSQKRRRYIDGEKRRTILFVRLFYLFYILTRGTILLLSFSSPVSSF